MITLNQLRKSYRGHRVLNALEASFPTGQITGIVGRNGSGKTTLFRCLAGLTDYSGDIGGLPGKGSQGIGFLPTNPTYLPLLTGEEYLRLAIRARELPVPDLKARNIFQLPLTEYAQQYSTGMKKKLALTAVLLQRNSLFLLDEPFNGVDLESNQQMNQLFRLLASKGYTLILSSHILESLTNLCDQIYVLENGRIDNPLLPSEYADLERRMGGEALDAGGLDWL
jgi:ABC-2 type transport system ATP-binding protein